MPENSPSSADPMIHNDLIRFIDLVYIQVKVIIDDVPCSCNQYRCSDQENELTQVMCFVDGKINSILITTLCNYNEEKVLPAYQSQEGNQRKVIVMMKDKISFPTQIDATVTSSPQSFLNFKTFSTTSRTQPAPPLKGEI